LPPAPSTQRVQVGEADPTRPYERRSIHIKIAPPTVLTKGSTLHIYDDPSDGGYVSDPNAPPDPAVLTPPPPPAPAQWQPATPSPTPPSIGTSLGEVNKSMQIVTSLLRGNPIAAVEAGGGLAGGALGNARVQAIAAVGSYYAGSARLLRGPGANAVAKATGVADAVPALADAGGVLDHWVPVVGNALGIAQAAVAAPDLVHQVTTGHVCSGRTAKDGLQVLAGGAGVIAIGLALAATGPEDLAAVGVVTHAGGLLSAGATAAGYLP
jgi:hypothetical protein